MPRPTKPNVNPYMTKSINAVSPATPVTLVSGLLALLRYFASQTNAPITGNITKPITMDIAPIIILVPSNAMLLQRWFMFHL